LKKIVETGVDFVELSVDSIVEFDDSKKDYTRSKKVFKLLLKYKKKHGFGLKTSLVLTAKNVDTIVETIKKINEKHKVPLTISFIRKTVNDVEDDESLFFNTKESKEKLTKVLDQIVKLKKNGARIMDPYYYFEGIKKFVQKSFEWDCMAGKHSFAVDYDGSILLCASMEPSKKYNILDIDKSFFKQKQEEFNKTKKWCTKICYSVCHNTSGHFINHPIKAILGQTF
ncbi:hypothetical protein ACFLZP_02535, partial [Patescibacteria group bacterium]